MAALPELAYPDVDRADGARATEDSSWDQPWDDDSDEWPVAPCIACDVQLSYEREALGESRCARCARQPRSATILDLSFPFLTEL